MRPSTVVVTKRGSGTRSRLLDRAANEHRRGASSVGTVRVDVLDGVEVSGGQVGHVGRGLPLVERTLRVERALRSAAESEEHDSSGTEEHDRPGEREVAVAARQLGEAETPSFLARERRPWSAARPIGALS